MLNRQNKSKMYKFKLIKDEVLTQKLQQIDIQT